MVIGHPSFQSCRELRDGKDPRINHPDFQIGFCRAGASAEVLGVEGWAAGHTPQCDLVSALYSVLWTRVVAPREVALCAGPSEGARKHGE